MDCPNCDVSLDRVKYENVQVQQCPQCRGYLIRRNRLRLIKSTRDQSIEDLQAEAEAHQRPDTSEPIRCPRCRVDRMTKERIRVEDAYDFTLDFCQKCSNVWLDGGELARLQMTFESSAKAVEAYAYGQREVSRTEAEKREFEQRLAEMPVAGNWVEGAVGDVGLMVIGIALFTAVPWLYWSFSAIASIAASVLLAGYLIWLAFFRVDASRDMRLMLSGAIVVAALLYPMALWWFELF